MSGHSPIRISRADADPSGRSRLFLDEFPVGDVIGSKERGYQVAILHETVGAAASLPQALVQKATRSRQELPVR